MDLRSQVKCRGKPVMEMSAQTIFEHWFSVCWESQKKENSIGKCLCFSMLSGRVIQRGCFLFDVLEEWFCNWEEDKLSFLQWNAQEMTEMYRKLDQSGMYRKLQFKWLWCTGLLLWSNDQRMPIDFKVYRTLVLHLFGMSVTEIYWKHKKATEIESVCVSVCVRACLCVFT